MTEIVLWNQISHLTPLLITINKTTPMIKAFSYKPQLIVKFAQVGFLALMPLLNHHGWAQETPYQKHKKPSKPSSSSQTSHILKPLWFIFQSACITPAKPFLRPTLQKGWPAITLDSSPPPPTAPTRILPGTHKSPSCWYCNSHMDHRDWNDHSYQSVELNIESIFLFFRSIAVVLNLWWVL